MSLVVQIVGQATLLPALQPTYGTPSGTLSRITLSKPCSCIAFTSAKVFPPPTTIASACDSMRAGSLSRCTERTSMPSSEKRACTLVR